LKIYLNNFSFKTFKENISIFTGGSMGINLGKSDFISNLGRMIVFVKHFVTKVIVRVEGK
jgi:hypothetical protein